MSLIVQFNTEIPEMMRSHFTFLAWAKHTDRNWWEDFWLLFSRFIQLAFPCLPASFSSSSNLASGSFIRIFGMTNGMKCLLLLKEIYTSLQLRKNSGIPGGRSLPCGHLIQFYFHSGSLYSAKFYRRITFPEIYSWLWYGNGWGTGTLPKCIQLVESDPLFTHISADSAS